MSYSDWSFCFPLEGCLTGKKILFGGRRVHFTFFKLGQRRNVIWDVTDWDTQENTS